MLQFVICLLETKQPVQEDKLTLKKVIDLVNKHDDQNLKEMNRKLQNVLEETLTKNMHLQEVRLLSKIYNCAQFLLIQVQLYQFEDLFLSCIFSLWYFLSNMFGEFSWRNWGFLSRNKGYFWLWNKPICILYTGKYSPFYFRPFRHRTDVVSGRI